MLFSKLGLILGFLFQKLKFFSLGNFANPQQSNQIAQLLLSLNQMNNPEMKKSLSEDLISKALKSSSSENHHILSSLNQMDDLSYEQIMKEAANEIPDLQGQNFQPQNKPDSLSALFAQNLKPQTRNVIFGVSNDSRRQAMEFTSMVEEMFKPEQIKKIRDGNGKINITAFLDFFTSLQSNRVKLPNGDSLNACQLLERMSPLSKPNEDLSQCVPLNIYLNRHTVKMAAIWACQNYSKRIQFFKLDIPIVSMDESYLNLMGEKPKRIFDQNSNPDAFMDYQQFSTSKPLDCKNPEKFISNLNIFEILN